MFQNAAECANVNRFALDENFAAAADSKDEAIAWRCTEVIANLSRKCDPAVRCELSA
jgi:hypothetical protein